MAKDRKEAEEFLQRLQQKRAEAFAMEMKKAKEFREMKGFNALADELGADGMQKFVERLLNEPKGLIKPATEHLEKNQKSVKKLKSE